MNWSEKGTTLMLSSSIDISKSVVYISSKTLEWVELLWHVFQNKSQFINTCCPLKKMNYRSPGFASGVSEVEDSVAWNWSRIIRYVAMKLPICKVFSICYFFICIMITSTCLNDASSPEGKEARVVETDVLIEQMKQV